MRKIKLAMLTDRLQLDGVGTVIMNYCTHLDRSKFDITIITGAPVAEANRFRCDQSDIQLIELPKRKVSPLKFYKSLDRELAVGKYNICHVHGNSATKSIELFIAWKNHIKVRVMHCHNSQCQHIRIHQMLVPIFKRLYTKAFACSEIAGNWIFEKDKFTVIPNAFETDKYRFDSIKREDYRNELNINDAFLIGFVGHLNAQKNYWHTVKCFEEYWHKKNPQAKLLMVGDGAGKEELKQYVNASACKNNIIIYGESDDIPGILSAIDVFVFPSHYEGLGIAAIEAQISGLPCIISEQVPREVQLSNQCVSLPIGEENISLWAEKLQEFSELSIDRTAFYEEHQKEIGQYDITEAAKFVKGLYLQCLEGSKY